MRIPRRRLLPFISLASLVALGSAACKVSPPVVDYNQIRDCAPEYDGKVISVEGYVGANRQEGLAFCSQLPNDMGTICLVSFASAPDEKTNLTLDIDTGTGPNQIENINRPGGMAENNTIDEENRRRITGMIRFRAHDGKILTARDKVRITGEYTSVPVSAGWPGSCSIAVKKIESL